jgi:hypothetical protein
MPQFARYLGIDYSGAETPTSSLKGLRVYAAEGASGPQVEVMPPPSPRKYWTRKGLAHWLVDQIDAGPPVLVGIDHAFSFPLRYFERHALRPDWPAFLEDFNGHWPTDKDNTYVCFVNDGLRGLGHKRQGDPAWFRLTERWTAAAKSVFQFDVQGQVATSTHAGLPWLRFLRQRCGEKLHFWPFDGWEFPSGKSLVAEVYPSLWMKRFPAKNRDSDQHAAFAVAAWLQRADQNDSLTRFLHPPLDTAERAQAQIEGWILGVT